MRKERDKLYDVVWNHCLCDVFQWHAFSDVSSSMSQSRMKPAETLFLTPNNPFSLCFRSWNN